MARKATRRGKKPPAIDADYAVYNGRSFLGSVAKRGAKFNALDAKGRRIGAFKCGSAARIAVIEAGASDAYPHRR